MARDQELNSGQQAEQQVPTRPPRLFSREQILVGVALLAAGRAVHSSLHSLDSDEADRTKRAVQETRRPSMEGQAQDPHAVLTRGMAR